MIHPETFTVKQDDLNTWNKESPHYQKCKWECGAVLGQYHITPCVARQRTIVVSVPAFEYVKAIFAEELGKNETDEYLRAVISDGAERRIEEHVRTAFTWREATQEDEARLGYEVAE